MKHLTLNLVCWIDMEVLEYLMQLDGVAKAEVNEDKDTLEIYYDDKIIPLKVLVMEVELFLKMEKTPSIIGFDKNSQKELVKKVVTVDDICCEYCVMGNIYDLLFMKGIEKVTTDYDFVEWRNINFFIEYDKDLISEEDVNKWKFV